MFTFVIFRDKSNDKDLWIYAKDKTPKDDTRKRTRFRIDDNKNRKTSYVTKKTMEKHLKIYAAKMSGALMIQEQVKEISGSIMTLNDCINFLLKGEF